MPHPPTSPFLIRSAAAAIAVLCALTGCQALQRTDSFMGFITPYRIDIVQGNVVTQEQVALLKTGMSRLEVRDVLGTPLLTDPFHANRWDYLFTLRRPGAEAQRRSVIVYFENDTVSSIDAPPDLPSEREFVASISRKKTIRDQKLELSDAEREALPTPLRKAVPPADPIGPVRSYPPLEAS